MLDEGTAAALPGGEQERRREEDHFCRCRQPIA